MVDVKTVPAIPASINIIAGAVGFIVILMHKYVRTHFFYFTEELAQFLRRFSF